MPQNEEGTRIEPLVSEPSAIGTSAPPTALPEPPEEILCFSGETGDGREALLTRIGEAAGTEEKVSKGDCTGV